MTNQPNIVSRIAGSANATVERVYKGDSVSTTLAAFEYSHQADMFAKVISKETDGTIFVRSHGRNYADGIFENGKELKGKAKGQHWGQFLKWEDSAK